jgi:ABC-2 type transport system permease protein
MNAIADTWSMTARDLRMLARQPWWIAVNLVQPVIWLLLFGSLFANVVKLPGFSGGDDYRQFLTPGIIVMTALFSAGWSGMSTIQDLERGVMDRFLVTPVGRVPLLAGRLLQNSIVIAIQSLIIVGLALATGASFPGGVPGILVLLVVAALLGLGFGALSAALGLVARREETLIAVVQFVLLPLTFMSTAFLPEDAAPGWIGTIGRFNPANWAIEAGREAVASSPDWATIGGYAGLLAGFALIGVVLATRALGAYQRSV